MLGFFGGRSCKGFIRNGLGTIFTHHNKFMAFVAEHSLLLKTKLFVKVTNDLTLLNWTRKNADERGYFCENSRKKFSAFSALVRVLILKLSGSCKKVTQVSL